MPGFHAYPQASCFFGDCLPEVSMVASAMPTPMSIDLNARPMAGGLSSGGQRKRSRVIPTDMHHNARNLFDRMPTTDDETDNYFIMANIILEVQGHLWVALPPILMR
ncbi:putative serine/threonine-protein kinase [Hordeum vulgare]|nr:putative serine/threonine-protein kinase [Hordeum vulgare]